MSAQTAFELDRSMRLAIGHAATLRDASPTPIDIVVEDISQTGCLFHTTTALAVGETVSIGIPGLGLCHGRISRADHPLYGCAFFKLISTDDIAAPDENVIVADFAASADPSMTHASSVGSPVAKLRLRTRFVIIVGASLFLWVPTFFMLRMLIGRL
jgi:hypothetical protein